MTEYRTVALNDVAVDRWRGFMRAQRYHWFTHDPYWCNSIDAANTSNIGFSVWDSNDQIRAIVPLSSTSNALVSGLNEPSGPLLADDCTDTERAAMWTLIANRLEAIAVDNGVRLIGVKFPVLTASGHRGVAHSDTAHLDRLGYQRDIRQFFHMNTSLDLDLIWSQVSSRMRSQIRAAERVCKVVPVSSDAEIRDMLRVYSEHSAAKGNDVPVTALTLRQLLDHPGITTLALLGSTQDKPAGFALSLGVGNSATLFSWGCNGDAGNSHLQKLMVWRSLCLLKEQGVAHVEYGGCITGDDRFKGLTEFYRRIGKSTLESVWAYRRIPVS